MTQKQQALAIVVACIFGSALLTLWLKLPQNQSDPPKPDPPKPEPHRTAEMSSSGRTKPTEPEVFESEVSMPQPELDLKDKSRADNGSYKFPVIVDDDESVDRVTKPTKPLPPPPTLASKLPPLAPKIATSNLTTPKLTTPLAAEPEAKSLSKRWRYQGTSDRKYKEFAPPEFVSIIYRADGDIENIVEVFWFWPQDKKAIAFIQELCAYPEDVEISSIKGVGHDVKQDAFYTSSKWIGKRYVAVFAVTTRGGQREMDCQALFRSFCSILPSIEPTD
jgi:hypothetical protein